MIYFPNFFCDLRTTNTVICTRDVMHIVDCYLTTEINLQLFLIMLAE